MSEKKKAHTASLVGSRHQKAESSPGFLFWKAFNSWSRKIRDELEKMDLTQVQYSILAATSYLSSTDEPVSQQDIANQLSMDKMMVSDVVKTLERKKLLVRKAHPSDGRAFSLHLTVEGKQRLKQAVPIVESSDEQFFSVLRYEQLKVLIPLLEKLGQ